MQLRQSESLRVFNHHHGGIGHIHTDLNDRGGHQHIDFAALEPAHDDLFLVGVQASVQQRQAQADKP